MGFGSPLSRKRGRISKPPPCAPSANPVLARIATFAPAWVLYALAGAFAFFGVIFLLIPIIGVPLLLIGYVCFLAAGVARRQARKHEMRRQQGG